MLSGYVAVFPGCVVDEDLMFFPPDAECKAVCVDGRIHCVIYGRVSSSFTL